MNAQHTPGPWRLIHEDHDIYIDGYGWLRGQYVRSSSIVGNSSDPSMAIAVLDTGAKNVWNDELHDANIALISAAPDMLAALELIAASGQRNAAYDACVAAIAKAKGLQL